MNREQVAQVLAKIQIGDNRQVDRLVLAWWVEAIGEPVPCDVEDALEAVVQHRRLLPGVWLEPGHVLVGAKIAKERRQRIAERSRSRVIQQREITLDRAEFERVTREALEAERVSKGLCAVHGNPAPCLVCVTETKDNQ